MSSFNILDENLDILGSRLLEASAGTGKTFAIEHLVVRLLLQEEVDLEEILVVTFTRAATRELRTRIRLNIEKAAECLRSDSEGPAYLAPFRQEKESLCKLEQALTRFEHAQIFTIHGFCHKMLSEFAFEAQLTVTPEEDDYKGHMRADSEDFFRTALEEHIYSKGQLEILLKYYENDSDKLIDALIDLLQKQEEIVPIAHFEELYREFCARLKTFRGCENDLAQVVANYKKSKDSEKVISLFTAILEKGEVSAEEIDQLLLLDLGFRELKVKAKPFESLLLERLKKELFPILEQAKNPQNLILKMGFECRKLSKDRQRLRENMSPDEILKRMQSSLSSPSFLQSVAKKYKAIIIDEFQDTDPIQWDIFSAILDQKQLIAFYLIGDPKQSIYSFRNADIYTYLKAAEKLGNKSYLDTNYRSHAALVESLNRLFSAVDWMDLPYLEKSIPFMPVQAHAAAEEGGLHFVLVEGKSGQVLEEEFLFPFIAAKIQSFPNLKRAVLVKDRYQGLRLHQYLKKWGIVAVEARGSDLKETMEFSGMQALLRAALDPDDDNLIKLALCSGLIGRTVEDLNGEKMLQAQIQFQQLHLLLEEKGIGPFLSQCLCAFKMAKTPALMSLIAILIEQGVDVIAELKRSREVIEIRPEEQPDAVIIMTAFASKGLEFDVVFALSVAARHSTKEAIVRVKGHVVPFDEENRDCQIAGQETQAEKLRQLYVALTRAKKELYVPYIIEKKSSSAASPIEVFMQKAIAPEFEKCDLIAFLEKLNIDTILLDKPPKPSKIETVLIDEEEEIEKLLAPPSEFIYSFSSLVKHVPRQLSQTPGPEELPVGTETGILVHSLFEQIFVEGLHCPLQKDKIQSLIARKNKEFQEPLFQMIEKALVHPLIDFALCDIPKGNMMQELEFLFPHEQHLYKGFADLCFQHEGKYYILDWKTNYLGEKSMEAVMEENDYYLQASIYAEALHRYVKLFDNTLEFGGAFYYFLRQNTVYHFFSKGL